MTEPRWVDMRETHIGVVFLVGDHAYKMKKPVTTAFLDFSTPQRRLAAGMRRITTRCSTGAPSAPRPAHGGSSAPETPLTPR